MHRNNLKKDKMYANYAYVTMHDFELLSKYRAENSYEGDESDFENVSNNFRYLGGGHNLHSSDENLSDNGSNQEGFDSRDRDMLLAIRAPPGSTLEIPSEA